MAVCFESQPRLETLDPSAWPFDLQELESNPDNQLEGLSNDRNSLCSATLGRLILTVGEYCINVVLKVESNSDDVF
jgi:hypothetical protein